MNKKILLASNNPGKLREIQAMLAEHAFDVVAQAALGIPDADETGLTFIENAIIKARQAALLSGLASVADDSGLEVDILGGAPGIYSARFAGMGSGDAANNAKLLAELAGRPEPKFTARYRCVMVYMRHAEDPSPLIGQGVWEGEIIQEQKGQGGFGYDPYFWLPEQGCTAAELPADVKNRLSHRGKALKELVKQIVAAAG